MVTVKAEARCSSTDSNGMLTLARTHKGRVSCAALFPDPGDVHTVLLRARHYRAGASIWCLCARDDARALALLTSRRCPADEDNGYGDEKEEGDFIKTDDEVLETELSAEAQRGVWGSSMARATGRK